MALDDPQFVVIDPAQIIADCVAFYQSNYEAITGQSITLQPAQIEQLIINMFAYRETLTKNSINEAAKQNLVSFSTAPILDYLAELVGVIRIPDQPATCTIEFTLTTGHGSGVIPAGLRIATTDGAFVFQTDNAVAFTSGDTVIDILCTAQQTGLAGNGYIAGTVIQILDPQSFITSATNINTTSGATDEETDIQLRARIKLAPSQYSTAGSVGAYKFATFSADPTIIDVSVTNPVPGTVNIYPLVTGGIVTPGGVISKVIAACNAEKVRPLTDTVAVLSPNKIEYRITANLVLYDTADQIATQQQVTKNLTDFTNLAKGKLGEDILQAKLAALCNGADLNNKVYSVSLVLEQYFFVFFGYWGPVTGIILSDMDFGYCDSITVNVTSTTHG